MFQHSLKMFDTKVQPLYGTYINTASEPNSLKHWPLLHAKILWTHFVFLRLAPLAQLSSSRMAGYFHPRAKWHERGSSLFHDSLRSGSPSLDCLGMTLPKRYGLKAGFLQNHGLGYNHVTMVTLHAKSYVSQVFIRNQPHAMVQIFISCCHVFLTFCRENPSSKAKSIHFTSAKR